MIDTVNLRHNLQDSYGSTIYDKEGYKEFVLDGEYWYSGNNRVRFYDDPLEADNWGNPL
jgi:hypothetical protein